MYTDSEEKRTIGEGWEKSSEGMCLFLMLTERRFNLIPAKVSSAKA